MNTAQPTTIWCTGVLNATGGDTGHACMLGKIGRRVAELAPTERGRTEEDLVDRGRSEVTVNRVEAGAYRIGPHVLHRSRMRAVGRLSCADHGNVDHASPSTPGT